MIVAWRSSREHLSPTAFTVERNYYAISLLKVLGYSRREVNSMILDSYLVYSLLCYALSMPIALATLGAGAGVPAGVRVGHPLEFAPLDMSRGSRCSWRLGHYASRRKIERISLQEVLKSYGE